MGSVWKRYFYQASDSKRVENQQIEVYEKGREIRKMVIKRPLVNILFNRPTFGLYRLILNENDKETTIFWRFIHNADQLSSMWNWGAPFFQLKLYERDTFLSKWCTKG